MDELVNKVWSNHRFHAVARDIEIAWLSKEIGLTPNSSINIDDARKALQASAILACSKYSTHRQKAFRVATSTYELFGADIIPLEQAVRVVLARLDNFPSIKTRLDVNESGVLLPLNLMMEELLSAEHRTVSFAGDEIVLTKFQHELWKALDAGGKAAIAAPTSAGKSFILQNFLLSLFSKKSKQVVFYIVPTRALIAQVSEDIAERFKSDGAISARVVTVPITPELECPESAIYVMTQERVQLVLNAHSYIKPDVIIVDEAHSIVEGGRGVLLQAVVDELLFRNENAQVLFASPMIRNLNKFGEVFGVDDILEMSSVEPTVAQNFLLLKLDEDTRKSISVSTVGDGVQAESYIGNINYSEEILNRVGQLVAVSSRIGLGSTNIIYANGADEAEQIAIQLAEIFKERIATPRQQALSILAMESVHGSYPLAECIKKGIAFHYADIPTSVRRSVEKAMVEGEIDFLVCTSTLLQGVNLPAKNIFLCRPKKGNSNPLEATDFWNLAGRAGRLLKEFQGNIFLIEYESWKRKPLGQPKDTIIVPALENGILNNGPNLVKAILDFDPRNVRDNSDLESMVVRLYSDFSDAKLEQTFQRMNLDEPSVNFGLIAEALEKASKVVTIPQGILRNSPNISVHRQQQLLNLIKERIAEGKESIVGLIPKHPREHGVFESYAEIMKFCYEILLGRNTESSRIHRFHTFMALQWMGGVHMPVILDNQISRGVERSPEREPRSIIRATLQVIERDIRYQAVRIFGCYITILKYALGEAGYKSLVMKIPPIPLFLELGASDRTMISLLSMGLSRVTAKKINDVAKNKNMDQVLTEKWLKSNGLERFGLSSISLEELKAVLKR